ncbi:MAG: 1-deoxy-D-xylulose-5-phosphate reductoisomerase [Bacteroidales bacterium]|jgi:1-deoxy-D-xylulose-5-phosphate reductoisomerase|nr:1-deoxy-D-xylulose-5-phosphate reductoisomerase [Bacteroidales bacterium]
MKKHIAILGSTGSIGTQTLEVIEKNPETFVVEVLTAHNNADLLIKQAIQYNPNTVIISNKEKYSYVFDALDPYDIKVFAGEESLIDVVSMDCIDIVVGALVGYAGLLPIIEAIKHNKIVALANKEVLVVAGQLVHSLLQKHTSSIIPIDSEHSAIFQCLSGELAYRNEAEKIILTASGGPFRSFSYAQLESITKEDALKHPNWDMGAKVTIDSASLMNKGLEMIEAKWLFGVEPKNIEIVIHPQSIIHSAVQFCDGSIKAQMGLPDMKLPIQYALTYPHRIYSDFPRFNFFDYPQLTFEQADMSVFRNLALAFEAISQNGNIPCVMNAANEVAVEAFLHDKVSFCRMSDIIAQTMDTITFIQNPQLSDYVETHHEAIMYARSLI